MTHFLFSALLLCIPTFTNSKMHLDYTGPKDDAREHLIHESNIDHNHDKSNKNSIKNSKQSFAQTAQRYLKDYADTIIICTILAAAVYICIKMSESNKDVIQPKKPKVPLWSETHKKQLPRNLHELADQKIKEQYYQFLNKLQRGSRLGG